MHPRAFDAKKWRTLFYQITRRAIEEFPHATDEALITLVIQANPGLVMVHEWHENMLAILIVQRIRIKLGLGFHDPEIAERKH